MLIGENELGVEHREAIISIVSLAFKEGKGIKITNLTVTDEKSGRKFLVNLEIKESVTQVVDMNAGLTGKSKLS